MKIFRKEFLSLSLINRFSSRFYLKALFESSKQSQMDNTTDYYWVNYLGRTFSNNNPTNKENLKEGFDTHNSFVTQVQLAFRPFLSYSYVNSLRVSDWGSSPRMWTRRARAPGPTSWGQQTTNGRVTAKEARFVCWTTRGWSALCGSPAKTCLCA